MHLNPSHPRRNRNAPDIRGVYEINLTVTDNDIPPISASDTVLVTVINHPPVANAGADINIGIGGTANLYGSGSDLDSDAIVGYAWTIVSAPYGSTAAVSDPTIADPTFTPVLRGDYTLGLSVYDGMDWGAVDTMQVHVFNNRPIAVAAGATADDLAVHYGHRNAIQLDGSASWDPDGDPIMFYRWEVTSKPEGSTLLFSNDLIANPIVSIDKFGTYQVSLYVSDGNIESAASTLTLTTPYTAIGLFENFESGVGTWVQVNVGGPQTIGISTAQKYSPTRSWSAKSCTSGGICGSCFSSHRVHKSLPADMHVVKLSVWNAWTTGSTGGGVGGQQFFTNSTSLGSIIQSTAKTTWVYNELALNQVLDDIGLYAELSGGGLLSGTVYWDDLTITVWN